MLETSCAGTERDSFQKKLDATEPGLACWCLDSDAGTERDNFWEKQNATERA